MRRVAVIQAVLMGLSRLYVGVHYPSDVLGGAWWERCVLHWPCISAASGRDGRNKNLAEIERTRCILQRVPFLWFFA